jgi:hypothetical protein
MATDAYHNPFFVARRTELVRWRDLLEKRAPLSILNIHGHSGIGKTWLLGAYQDACREAQVPFARLDIYRLGESLNATALFLNLADQLHLEMEHHESVGLTFDRLLPYFLAALATAPYSVVALMVDDYDQLFHLVDPWLRHLFRALQGFDQFTGPTTHRPAVSLDALPRIRVVINSHEPVSQRWPPNPLYQHVLDTMQLTDFSYPETCTYLTRREINPDTHQPFYRLTRGHPLALSLLVSLCRDRNLPPTMPEAAEDVMEQILTWALRDVEVNNAPASSQLSITELLRACAVVRRFSQPLLARMLDQARIPDALFDQVTALSMVTERKRLSHTNSPVFAQSKRFALHDVLRAALLKDAQKRGLNAWMDTYRRRALLFYAQRLSGDNDGTLGEEGLDLLFLHRDSLIRDLFFGPSSVPLTPDHVSYHEMKGVIDPLMRDNLYYQMINFDGEPLERFIRETREWLALDRKLHGEALQYFHVVRRSHGARSMGQGDIAGFVLIVPVTDITLPYLRQETVGAVYEAACQPIELRKDKKVHFSLRIVADDLDSFSALLRILFLEMANQPFDRLITMLPWPQLSAVLETMGFDVLARQFAYEGCRYDVVQLDVGRRGSASGWLFRLVREDLGLPPHSLLEHWEVFKQVLEEALEGLHDSFQVQAKSPLIDEFALAERTFSDWERTEALIQTLQAVLEPMRLPETGRVDTAFHTLNERYGVVNDAWRRFEFSGKPSLGEIAKRLDCSKGTLYRRSEDALEAYARAFRRWLEED